MCQSYKSYQKLVKKLGNQLTKDDQSASWVGTMSPCELFNIESSISSRATWMPSAEPPLSRSWYGVVPEHSEKMLYIKLKCQAKDNTAIGRSYRTCTYVCHMNTYAGVFCCLKKEAAPGMKLKSPINATGVPSANLLNLMLSLQHVTMLDVLENTNWLSHGPVQQQAAMNVDGPHFLGCSLGTSAINCLRVLKYWPTMLLRHQINMACDTFPHWIRLKFPCVSASQILPHYSLGSWIGRQTYCSKQVVNIQWLAIKFIRQHARSCSSRSIWMALRHTKIFKWRHAKQQCSPVLEVAKITTAIGCLAACSKPLYPYIYIYIYSLYNCV